MRDSLYPKVKALHALNLTAISADTDTNGASINLDQSGRDYRTAMFVAYAATVTDGNFAVVPQESANGTDWTDVPATRLQGSGAITASNTVAEVGVIPDPAVSPYLRVRITSTETDSGGSIGAVLLLGSPGSTPIVRP